MNAPLNSDSTLYPAPETTGVAASSGYSPSVPISVYRELATELKTTQVTVEALTQQNQQLMRQNKLLRNEIQRFVQAAEQLGHFAGVTPQEPPVRPDPGAMRIGQELPTKAMPPQELPVQPVAAPIQEDIFTPEPVSPPQNSAIVPRPQERPRDRPRPPQPEPIKQRLFTEQPEGMRPLSKVSARSDLGNLWLVTTILLVVFTAFGAGFLIMRPLLNR